MDLIAWFKSLVITQLLMGYIFLSSGCLVTFLMMIGIVMWPFSKSLYRKYTVYLSYALWSQFSFLAQWWCCAECDLYISPDDLKYLGNEHCVVVVNHTYEMDWLMTWMMAERRGMLGNTKIYGKQILKFVPVIGWTWYFTESIFLKRDWNDDKKILEKSIAEIVTYPENFWVTLLLFPEGTRWTPAKHEICQKIAREKGYPEYTHMLLPRTKGFALSMELMKGKIPAVYDVTIGFPSNKPEPTLMDCISGKKPKCSILLKRHLIEDIPSNTEEECGVWLRDLYKQKDDTLKHYLKTEKFEGPPVTVLPQRNYDLYLYIFWTITMCTPLFIYLKYVLLYASWVHLTIDAAVFTILIFVAKWMIRFSEIKHGTSYGLEKKVDKKTD